MAALEYQAALLDLLLIMEEAAGVAGAQRILVFSPARAELEVVVQAVAILKMDMLVLLTLAEEVGAQVTTVRLE